MTFDVPNRPMAEDGKPAATLSSSVYEQLRGDILSGALPPGEKLRVEFVRERYQAGNSPVREALSRLSSEGFVERREQRGFFVAATSLEELQELTRTRCWVEEKALRESIANHSQHWEEQLVIAYHRMKRTPRFTEGSDSEGNPDWERCHRDFHYCLISNCGSRLLVDFCMDLADLAYRYRQVAVATKPNRKAGDEHELIFNAVLNGDADEAVRCLTDHYHNTAGIILESMESDS